MPIAAVPDYLGQDFKEASPGMRFGIYFSGWEPGFRMPKNKVPTVKPVTPLRSHAATLTKLRERQDALAQLVGAWSLDARATAPFTTGLGNEHPLENGFAFLNPYGLPYLPGSGVKGVARRAAQELAQGLWEDDCGWKGHDQRASYWIETGSGKNKRRVELSVLDILFGREPPSGDSDAVRGALAFWDVIPQIQGDRLMVEIMTPHQSHYYQDKREAKSGNSNTPHDSGQPNPIAFLTVPPGSRFSFCVVCDAMHLARLTANKLEGAPDLLAQTESAPLWQRLIRAAFEHAFEWLGFGAKTAVGYGAMSLPGDEAEGKGAETGKSQTTATAATAREETWPAAKLSWNPGPGELYASAGNRRTAPLRGEAAQKLIAALGDRANRLRRNRELLDVSVRVRIEGNMIALLGLASGER